MVRVVDLGFNSAFREKGVEGGLGGDEVTRAYEKVEELKGEEHYRSIVTTLSKTSSKVLLKTLPLLKLTLFNGTD